MRMNLTASRSALMIPLLIFSASCISLGKEEKHGHADIIDKFLAKAVPFWESQKNTGAGLKAGKSFTPPEEAPAVDALPNDEELVRQALDDATKDKVDFFVSVQNIVQKDRKRNDIGELEQLIVTDDTAAGHTKVAIMPGPGEAPAVRKIEKTLKFRRINGGWLPDSL